MLEQIRNSLRIAFSSNCVVTNFFEEEPDCDLRNPVFRKKSYREVYIDGRIIKVEAEPVRTLAFKSFKNTKVPIDAEIFRHLIWCRAVRQLTPVHKAWLHYCYSGKQDYEEQKTICLFIWNELLNNKALPKLNKKSKEVMKPFVLLIIQEVKEWINQGTGYYESIALAKLANKKPDVWCHCYQPRWNFMFNTLIELDEKALEYAKQLHTRERTRQRMLIELSRK